MSTDFNILKGIQGIANARHLDLRIKPGNPDKLLQIFESRSRKDSFIKQFNSHAHSDKFLRNIALARLDPKFTLNLTNRTTKSTVIEEALLAELQKTFGVRDIQAQDLPKLFEELASKLKKLGRALKSEIDAAMVSEEESNDRLAEFEIDGFNKKYLGRVAPLYKGKDEKKTLIGLRSQGTVLYTAESPSNGLKFYYKGGLNFGMQYSSKGKPSLEYVCGQGFGERLTLGNFSPKNGGEIFNAVRLYFGDNDVMDEIQFANFHRGGRAGRSISLRKNGHLIIDNRKIKVINDRYCSYPSGERKVLLPDGTFIIQEIEGNTIERQAIICRSNYIYKGLVDKGHYSNGLILNLGSGRAFEGPIAYEEAAEQLVSHGPCKKFEPDGSVVIADFDMGKIKDGNVLLKNSKGETIFDGEYRNQAPYNGKINNFRYEGRIIKSGRFEYGVLIPDDQTTNPDVLPKKSNNDWKYRPGNRDSWGNPSYDDNNDGYSQFIDPY